MNMQNQNITAAFLMEGLRDTPVNYNELITCWNQGCIEMVAALVAYVPFIARATTAAAKVVDNCWPGVFDYEVSGSFGKWFGCYIMEHGGDEPPQIEARQYLVKEIVTFFAQGQDEATARAVAATVAAEALRADPD